jgi:hypothetical protein
VGAVEEAGAHDAAIEVDEGAALFAGPEGGALEGLLAVGGDGVVVDGVEAGGSGGDGLMGFGGREAAELLDAEAGRRAGGEGEGEEGAASHPGIMEDWRRDGYKVGEEEEAGSG